MISSRHWQLKSIGVAISVLLTVVLSGSVAGASPSTTPTPSPTGGTLNGVSLGSWSLGDVTPLSTDWIYNSVHTTNGIKNTQGIKFTDPNIWAVEFNESLVTSFGGHIELTGPDTNLNSSSLIFTKDEYTGWTFFPSTHCGGAFTITVWDHLGGSDYINMGSVSAADKGC